MIDKKPVKIVFVDDSEISHFVLRSMVSRSNDFDFLSMEKDGHDLLCALENKTAVPEIGIVDIHMPKLNGIATTKRLLKLYPEMKVYGFTSSSDKVEKESMLKAGAFKIFAKDQLKDLLDDIRQEMGRA